MKSYHVGVRQLTIYRDIRAIFTCENMQRRAIFVTRFGLFSLQRIPANLTILNTDSNYMADMPLHLKMICEHSLKL